MIAAELHTHSAASHDGRDPIELLLGQAAAVDLDALAITDHDTIEASLRAVELAADYDLIGIPGIEISSAHGHIIGLGVTQKIPPGQSYHDTLAQIREQGGIAITPHPFQQSRSGVAHKIGRDDLAQADAIEVYNSRLLTGRANRKADRFCQEYGVPRTAGSDAHISEMVGQAVTIVDADPDEGVDGILAAIRDGRTKIQGKRTPWRISFRQAAGGVRRRISRRLDRVF